MGGRGTDYTGIEPRHGRNGGGSIRITFNYQFKRRRETLKIQPTQANLKRAAKLRADILDEIRLGVFDYAEHFPDSAYVRNAPVLEAQPCTTTFGVIAGRWLAAKQDMSTGTLSKYRQALDKFWLPEFRNRDIREIPYSEIAELVGAIDWPSAKHRNNSLIPLRGVFDMAYADRLLPENPTNRINNQKHQESPPDPFTKEEADNILKYMRGHFHPQVTNYFMFCFYSGVRPEEAIALLWGDYDAAQNTIRIQRAFSYGEVKGTKTEKVRDIHLTPQATLALLGQKEHTFLAGRHIFLNPVTGNPWADQAKQRIRYWEPALKRLGIRYRPPKNTRHTYATMLLMSGCNPAYAAGQMGHSVQVFFKVYAKWIQGQANLEQHEKLLGYLSNAPNAPQIRKDIS